MDGLSAAGSGISVVSLAIQLGDSIKKLCEFWTSVKEAPDDVRAITADLQLLTSVLAGVASEEQNSGPDPTLIRVLQACGDNVTKLSRIANDMEPGFESKKPRVRIWTAFRAAIKGESIQKSQRILEGLKSTLTLALHNHHNRLIRIWHHNQQQDITTILRHLSGLNLDQPIAFRDEASRFQRTVHNSTQGVDFEIGRDVAVRDVAKMLQMDQSRTIRSPPNSEDGRSTQGCYQRPPLARQQTWKSYYNGLTQTFFGAMNHTIKTTSLRSGFILDDILNDEEYPSEQEESFQILPARWLLKLGFNCAYNFSIHNSSTRIWKFSINPINLVPDDAPIFEYCMEGNVEKVRDLISRNLASARDVDSNGRTALHSAAFYHRPELCKFLIGEGADKTARTFFELSPLLYISYGKFTQDGLVDAIDTCRIFDDSYDFWDGSGDGWVVLDLITGLYHAGDDRASAEFSSWFVQSSIPDIKAYYDKNRVSNFIYNARPETLDSMGLLLELGPPGIVDYEAFGTTSLIQSIETRDHNKIRALLACGADPHKSSFLSGINRLESPLSLAMYSSWAFCSFRDALMEMNFQVEDIVRRELEQGGPLLDDGWQTETLSALLKLDFEPGTEPTLNYRCTSCHLEKIYDVLVQPHWHNILERIKNGTYVQNARSDTQDAQSPSSQNLSISTADSLPNTTSGGPLSQEYALPDNQSNEDLVVTENPFSRPAPGKEEIWCFDCWRHFKETGRRRSPAIFETSSSDEDDSSEDDFSPFLINT